ncbi:hypothetical protein D3C85_644790 [compost metagenome]
MQLAVHGDRGNSGTVGSLVGGGQQIAAHGAAGLVQVMGQMRADGHVILHLHFHRHIGAAIPVRVGHEQRYFDTQFILALGAVIELAHQVDAVAAIDVEMDPEHRLATLRTRQIPARAMGRQGHLFATRGEVIRLIEGRHIQLEGGHPVRAGAYGHLATCRLPVLGGGGSRMLAAARIQIRLLDPHGFYGRDHGVSRIGDHRRGAAGDHRAIAVGHLDRQGQGEAVARPVIQVGVYLHLVVERRLGMGVDTTRHARQGDAQHQGAARRDRLEAVAIAARHLLPGQRLAVVGNGVAAPIHHQAKEGQPHIHHGIGIRRDGQGAGGLLIIAGLVVAGAIEAAFTERHPGQGDGRVVALDEADVEGARGAVVVAAALVAVDDIDLERQLGGTVTALVNPLEQGHLVVKAVAGGIVELAHQFYLEHLDAHAVHFHIAFEDLVARDGGIPAHQFVFDTLAQGAQGRLLGGIGERHLTHPIRARIDLEVAGAGQGVAAIEVALIQAHPAARHEDGRITVFDGQRQLGGDPVPVLVGQRHIERQIEGLAPLVIQLADQGDLGCHTPVAVALH